MKIVRHKNPNVRKLTFLLLFQVVLALIPATISIYFIVRYILFGDVLAYEKPPYGPFLPENVSPEATVRNLSVGLVFIGIVLFSFAGFVILSQRYNILSSGYKGESTLKKLVARIDGVGTASKHGQSPRQHGCAFMNLPIRYRRGKSEIDMLLVSRRGVIIIEVKNHSGCIMGDCHKLTWQQHKVYRDGKVVDTEMNNPFMQLKRQRDILKNILRAAGVEVWIDSILLFSNPKARLRLTGKTNEICFAGGDALSNYINSRPTDALTDEEVRRIVEIVRGLDS